MTHELMTLPYAADALAPVISKETVEFHHGKHLLAYVNTLNSLIPGTEFENADLLDIVRKSEGKIFNQAGQVLNHNLYFTQFGPNAGGAPKGALADAIAKEWGSFEAFQAAFLDENGVLTIEKEPNAGNPIRKGLNPLLGFDVWEHSYYLGYQNRRADHIKDLWSIVRWDVVEERYNK